MTIDLTHLIPMLTLIAAWIETADGTNTIFALIITAALLGVNDKLCWGLTLALHLLLIFI